MVYDKATIHLLATVPLSDITNICHTQVFISVRIHRTSQKIALSPGEQ